MKAWKTGAIFNSIIMMSIFILLMFLWGGIIPDSGFTRHISDFIDRSNIFTFGSDHWWRFALFVVFVVIYFIMSGVLPISILNKSLEQLHPERNITISSFGVYSFFGLITPGGIFFLLGLFFIRKDLWRFRERKFRDFIESGRNEEEDIYPEEDSEDDWYNEHYSSVQEPIHQVEREQTTRGDELPREREVDRLERRLDDIEDDLYYQKRKNRKVNKTLDDIEDILSKR